MSPLVTLLVFIGSLYARNLLHRRHRQRKLHRLGFPWALMLQPYAIFFAALAVGYVSLVVSYLSLVANYGWLNPSRFERPDVRSSESRRRELEQYDIPGWLFALSMVAPFSIGVTFAATVVHLWKHVPPRPEHLEDDNLRWYPTFSHDLAMQVVALPLVYGLFAFDSVHQFMLMITGASYKRFRPSCKTPDEQFHYWQESVFIQRSAYETNFELADLYEAWALRAFGILCFAIVSRQVLREAPTVKYLIDTVRRHLGDVATEDDQDVRVLRDLVLLSNPQSLLFQPLMQTSRLGVMVFVYTYAFKSAYSLTLTVLAMWPLHFHLCGEDGLLPEACSLEPYADGAALLASTLAIMNIVLFEHHLKIVLDRQKFKPFAKFLAVKVLVSIVFIQSYGLDLLLGSLKYSQVQIKLCYACLICCEVLPLSLLVFCAWRPQADDWYGDDLQSDGADGTMSSNSIQLADEAGSYMNSDSYVRSRQLNASMGARNPMPWELTAVLELRGDVQAQDGKALEDVVRALSSGRFQAVYKPAALYRDHRPRGPSPALQRPELTPAAQSEPVLSLLAA